MVIGLVMTKNENEIENRRINENSEQPNWFGEAVGTYLDQTVDEPAIADLERLNCIVYSLYPQLCNTIATTTHSDAHIPRQYHRFNVDFNALEFPKFRASSRPRNFT